MTKRKASTMLKIPVQEQESTRPDVSLLLPVRNGIINYPDGGLKKAIDTALGQRGVTVEICAVNDGSTDGTLKLLQSYKSKIKLIDSERVGVGEATNKAAKIADGRYIMQYSARAFLNQNGLVRMVKTLDNSNAGFTYAKMTVWGEIDRIQSPPAYVRSMFLQRFEANFFMFRSEAMKKCEFRDYVDLEDGNRIGVVDRDFMMQLIVDMGYDGVATDGDTVVVYNYTGDITQGSVVLARNRAAVMREYNKLWEGAK